MKGIVRVDAHRLFPRVGKTATRGHTYKIKGVDSEGMLEGGSSPKEWSENGTDCRPN